MTFVHNCGEVLQDLLTVVGGLLRPDSKATNKLVSLSKREEAGKWIDLFPSMPTSHQGTTYSHHQPESSHCLCH